MNNPLRFTTPSGPAKRFSGHISSFQSGDVDLKQGIFDNAGYCSLCQITCPHHHDKVTCSTCNRTFHTPCLLDKIGRATVATLARNPSLWWFCLECLHVSNSADVHIGRNGMNYSDVSSESNSSFVSESELQDHLSALESKIYSRLKHDLDQSLSKITTQPSLPDHPSRDFHEGKSPDRSTSGRKFSSSSGFSESQGSLENTENNYRYKATSKKTSSRPSSRTRTTDNDRKPEHSSSLNLSRKTEYSSNMDLSRKPEDSKRVEPSRKLYIPEIAKVSGRNGDAMDPILAKSELRKQNATDLSIIRNLVQRGRNVDIA